MRETQAHILIVDDDDRIRDLLMRYLSKQPYVLMDAEDAAHAREIMRDFIFDIVILDVMMPGESGLNLARFIKDSSHAAVILLTARGSVEERIEGFEAGADDYLPKPFEPKELLMRIEAVLRRTMKRSENAANMTHAQAVEHNGDEAEKPQALPSFGGWRFDAASKSVTHDERGVVYLTDSEVALLQSFLRKPNTPIRRDVLAEQIGMGGQDRAIDVQITRLRKKIEDNVKHPTLIQTIRGQGYLLRL